MTTRDWIIITALGAGFGFTFLFNEILLRDLGPLSISMGRTALGALALWLLVAIKRMPVELTGRDLMNLAVLGLFMFAMPFALFPLSQQWITGGLAGIVNAMTPLAVVVVSHFWPGGERATLLKVAGVLSGLFGIVILSLPGLAAPGIGQSLGIGLALLAPVSYAIALNHVRQLAATPMLVVTAASMSAAAIMLVPVVVVVEGIPSELSPLSLLSLGILGPVLTGWFFFGAMTMMRRVGATASSTITFIAPISAVILGAVLLGEEVGWAHVWGMAAIFLGLVFIDGRLFARRHGKAHPQPKG